MNIVTCNRILLTMETSEPFLVDRPCTSEIMIDLIPQILAVKLIKLYILLRWLTVSVENV